MNRIKPIKQLQACCIALFLSLTLLFSACETSLPAPDTGTSAPTDSVGALDPSTTEPATSQPAGTVPPSCLSDGAHTDANDDGICDACAATVITYIDFFALNDLHGKFMDTDKQPGVDELTTYLKNAYLTEEQVVILSSGDMWQGSSESNLTKGHLMTEWMNELDVVSMTLGNHEYDWGEESIEANAALAEFPFLAINVYDRETHAPADYCRASVMVERGGAQIGIIGAIGDCYSSISGEMSGDVYFKVGSELTALVKAESERLRAAGADFIVYSLHDGYGDSRASGYLTDSQLASYYDPTLSDGYVDLVFEGHTHQQYVLEDSEGVYHLQGGGENRGISHAEIRLNVANGNHHVTAEFVPSGVYDDLTDHPSVAGLLEKYKDQVSIGTEVLGYNKRRRTSDELRELVARLYFETGDKAWGADYDIVLGGGFLSVRSPYELSVGEVTYSKLQSLFPFDNTLVLCSIRGQDLLDKFIHTRNDHYFNYYGDYGQSVKDQIDPNETYYVIVDTYTSTYGPNRLTEVARYTADVYARDLLADYIRAGGLE